MTIVANGAGRAAMFATLLLAMPVHAANATGQAQAAPSAFPEQVWVRIPYAPTAFPAEGRQHLFYELYLTNFTSQPIPLDSLDVIDPAATGEPPLAHLTGSALQAVAQPVGSDADAARPPLMIPGGGTSVLFLEVAIANGRPVPRQLVHRVGLGAAAVVTPPLRIGADRLKVLGPPVRGTAWLAGDGPGNDPGNHHRRGILVRNGVIGNSRRFAIDWQIVKDGTAYRGDPRSAASYFCYGAPLLAVADATVLRAEDGYPDNPPGHGADFHPSMPLTFGNSGGNAVALDLGDGQYAHYYHLRPGSLRVHAGDHVRRGQVIGVIGSSGDAREPHVHFEITNSAAPLDGEGLAYVIDRYAVLAGHGDRPGPRARELPLDGMMIDFGR